MSLVRHHEHFVVEPSEGIYFRMTDGSVHILCMISHQALRDRRALDGGDADLSETFMRHRRSIEAIADGKYQAGCGPNDLVLVLSKDLMPPAA